MNRTSFSTTLRGRDSQLYNFRKMLWLVLTDTAEIANHLYPKVLIAMLVNLSE